MSLAGAFVYMCFISVDEIISGALYIFNLSYLSFHLMVKLNWLVLVSLAHFRLRCAFVFYNFVAFVMDHRLLAMVSLHRYFNQLGQTFEKLVVFRRALQRFFIFPEQVQRLSYRGWPCLDQLGLDIIKEAGEYIRGH